MKHSKLKAFYEFDWLMFRVSWSKDETLRYFNYFLNSGNLPEELQMASSVPVHRLLICLFGSLWWLCYWIKSQDGPTKLLVATKVCSNLLPQFP